MSNTQLPAEVVSQIKNDAVTADVKNQNKSWEYRAGFRNGHEECATEYATKLHEAQQEIESLKRWKMEAVELLTPINAYVHKHMEKSLGQSCVKLVLDRCKQYEQARVILETALTLLPGTSPIHDKIQTFLDGTTA